MLSKRIDLTIKDYTATLSSEIKFYKNDCLDLIFGIKEYGVKVRNGIAEANLMPINALNAKLLINNLTNEIGRWIYARRNKKNIKK